MDARSLAPAREAAAREAARTLLVGIKKISSGREAYRRDAFFQAADSRFDGAVADSVIKEAKRGERLAREAIHHAIAWFVQHGEPLPEPLRAYLLDLLLSEESGHQGKRGPAPHDHYLRDSLIRLAVRAVMEYGFDRTRNRETEAPSACSIVCEVLAEDGIGIDMSISNVERITESASQ